MYTLKEPYSHHQNNYNYSPNKFIIIIISFPYSLHMTVMILIEFSASHLHPTDIQGTSATSGEGLYEGLSWLQSKLTGKQAKKAVTQPIVEVKDSLSAKNGLVSSWFSSIASYFTKKTTEPVDV